MLERVKATVCAGSLKTLFGENVDEHFYCQLVVVNNENATAFCGCCFIHGVGLSVDGSFVVFCYAYCVLLRNRAIGFSVLICYNLHKMPVCPVLCCAGYRKMKIKVKVLGTQDRRYARGGGRYYEQAV